MALSRKSKEAIKTALAMTIAYGIALSMDWDRPYWAGLTVALISLPTTGMSLNKGAMRMLGTLVAGAAALTFIALFSQERWWFMVVLSLYVGVCAYLMTGKNHQYFYQISAVVCVIVSFDGGANSENAFQTAMIRIQETGMGVLVYTLIAVFLWPRSSRGELDKVSGELFAAQRQLYDSCRELLAGRGAPADLQKLRRQEVQLFGRLANALDAAETDTYDVWEKRDEWRWFQRQSTALGEAIEHWRLSFPETQLHQLTELLPNLEAVCAEVDLRLTEIERMLAGQAPERSPQAIIPAIDKSALNGLSHFQKAAVTLNKAHLDRIETVSRSLFECVRVLKGYARQAWTPPREKGRATRLLFDVDRFGCVIRVLAALWIAFLIWVYIDPPGGSGIVTMVVPLGLAFALMPQLNVSTTLLPAVLSCVFGGVFYIFIMPHLSTYAQLGLMIFCVTFAINYLLAAPKQALARLFCLAFFLVITSIDNEQTYSFLQFASTMVMIILGFLVLVVTAYIPTSPRPEKAFLRLLSRFFRHAESLTTHLVLDWAHNQNLTNKQRAATLQSDLIELSEKLAVWGQHIDYRTFPDNTPESVAALVTNLQALAYRIAELIETRDYPQADLLMGALSSDLRAWRILVEKRFRLWADNPTVAIEPSGQVQERLTARLAEFENRLDETFRQASESNLGDEDFENAYRLLGGFRGLSEAMIAYAHLADGMNWAQWQEERF